MALRELNNAQSEHFLGKNLALDLFIHNKARSVLRDIVNNFARVIFMRPFFLNSAQLLDVYKSIFLKRPSKS